MLDANFPTNLMDFQDRFGSERKCVAYLFAKRYPEGFRCPRCAGRKGYKISKRVLIECASCEYQASLTAGTMFHGRYGQELWIENYAASLIPSINFTPRMTSPSSS